MQRTALGLAIVVIFALGATPARSGNSGTGTWPPSIKGGDGFRVLGQAIAAEPDFPKGGSDIEKARYIFLRMDEVARKYDLKAGTGWPLSQAEIGLSRFFSGIDHEQAETLKSIIGLGNCAEWAYAFSSVLQGANVEGEPVFGDDTKEQGHSFAFWTSDTAVLVREIQPSGKVSRRIFDVFQAAFRSGVHQPTERTLLQWSDLPLSDADYTDTDLRNPYRHRPWLAEVGKKYVKDASSEKLYANEGKRPNVEAARWGGTFGDAERVIHIMPSFKSFTGNLKWTNPGETFEKHGGTETWKNCRIDAAAHAVCEFTGEYHDPDKSIVTGGTVDMTLVRNTLTRAVTLTVANATWHGPSYPSAVHVGAVLHDTTVRK